MDKTIKQLEILLKASFILIGIGLVYWQVFQAETLLTRADNPRQVIAAQRIQRGSIVTASGDILAETILDEDGFAQRMYHYSGLGPVLGYYSFRYGTSGLEDEFDAYLRGEEHQTWLNDWLHRPGQGQPLTITLDLPAQMASIEALTKADVSGAVVVLDSQTGQVLVLASYPSFDPNTLEEDWDALVNDPTAPLLNRASQGIFAIGNLAELLRYIQQNEGYYSLRQTVENLGLTTEVPFNLPGTGGVLPVDLPEKAEEIALTPMHVAVLGANLLGYTITPTLILMDDNGLAAHNKFPFNKNFPHNLEQTEFSGFASAEITGNDPVSWYLGLHHPQPNLVTVVVVSSPRVKPDLAASIVAEIP